MNRFRSVVGWLSLLGAESACGPAPEISHLDRFGPQAGHMVCAAGSVLQGVDVSHDQGPIDWRGAALAGLSFGIAKASEGLTFRDVDFPSNWAGMKAAGLLRGAYHFFRAADDGAAQADAYLAYVGTIGRCGDLPPVLDWEATDGESIATNLAQGQAFIDEIRVKTGLATLIYTDTSFWASLGNPVRFAQSPLWFANYGVTCPSLPPPWTTWLFWQTSDAASVSGIGGAVDSDEFNGTLAELEGLVGDGGADRGMGATAGGTSGGRSTGGGLPDGASAQTTGGTGASATDGGLAGGGCSTGTSGPPTAVWLGFGLLAVAGRRRS